MRPGPIRPWVPWLLFMLVTGVALWSYFGFGRTNRAEMESRRWKDSAVAPPSEPFSKLSKTSNDDWARPRISVYSVPTLTPPRSLPTLRDLADNGQAHAIDYLAKNSSTDPHLWTDLQKALTDASEDAAAAKDPFRHDRVLVATVTKGALWNPGERMMWTRVFIQPINFIFAGYTVAGTENTTVRVANVEATTTRKFSAELGAAIPALEGTKASVAPSVENSVKATREVNAQYEKLGIDITPDFLRIIRESETGGDVVGNTTIALSILTDPVRIQKREPADERKYQAPDKVVLRVTSENLIGDDGADLTGDAATITVTPQVELLHCPLMAKIWMLYAWRRIGAGGEYYSEYQQNVTLERDADGPRIVEMVRADDVAPAVWSIQILPGDGEGQQETGTYVAGRVEGGDWREMVFTDFGLASRFAHWLRIHHASELSHLRFHYDGKTSVIATKKITSECPVEVDGENAKIPYRMNPNAKKSGGGR